MALDESKFETLKFLRCKQCGNVYTASLKETAPECPECSSHEAELFRPEGSEEDNASPAGGGL
jgi:ABC-type ATPase with predicted acetyltransferase domain